MLQPDDPAQADALDAAVTARTRRPLVHVRADWPRDGSFSHELADLSGWVDAVEVERSRTSELPAEVGLIDGYTSAEATVTLSGRNRDGRDALTTLSPWHEDSPLHGTPTATADLTVDLGLTTSEGPISLRQFTGPIRSLSSDYVARTVEVSALDPADRLRAMVTLPSGSLTRATHEASPRAYPWTTTTQWALDYVLRRNGIYTSPPPPDEDVIFSATLHGSHVAEVAAQSFSPRSDMLLSPYSGSYYRLDPEGVAHPHGVLAPSGDFNSAPSCQYVADGELWLGQGTGFGISVFGLFGEGPTRGDNTDERLLLVMPEIDNDAYFELLARNDGGLALRYIAGGSVAGVWALFADSFGSRAWRDVTYHLAVTGPGQILVRAHSEGSTYSWDDGVSVPAPPTSNLRAATRVSLYQPVPYTNVAVWRRPTAPIGAWPYANHEPGADLDPGLNEVTALPTVVAADSWEVLQEITASEYGLFGFDESGRPYFRNRATLADISGEVVRELRTTASIKELASEVNSDTVRNSIVWRAKPSWMSSILDTVVEAEEQREYQVIPGVTVFEIPVPPDVVISDGVNQVPHWDAEFWDDHKDQIIHGFCAQRNAGGADVAPFQDPPLMELWWELAAPRMGRLTVINRAGERVNLAQATDGTDGEPALKLGGNRVVEGVESVGEVSRPGSIAIYGQRGYEMSASPWRQLIGPQARVAGSLVAALANPVPVIEDVPVVGDPRLRIGDVVRLTDRDELSVRATLVRTVHGASSSDGLYSTVSVRPLAPPGLGVLDDDRRGRLDDSMVLAP